AVPFPSAAARDHAGALGIVFSCWRSGNGGRLSSRSETRARRNSGCRTKTTRPKSGGDRVGCAGRRPLVGNAWWNREAASYSQQIYKPLQMRPMVSDSGVLTLNVSDPGWLVRRPGPLRRAFLARTMDDLVPDHDYRMHLYMIRQPGLDVVYHVHPEQIESGVVQFKLPSMPAGTYRVYAD